MLYMYKLHGVRLTISAEEGELVTSSQIVDHADDGDEWEIVRAYDNEQGVRVYDLEFEPTAEWVSP